MKWALTAVLTVIFLAVCIHKAPGQEKASAGHPTVLEYEGVLTASDERAETITISTGRDKAVLTFTGNTAVKVRGKDSPSLFYESRGGVLLSIALAHILVGDRVHVTCEPAKSGSGIVCRKIEVEASAPHSQNHTRFVPGVPSVVADGGPQGGLMALYRCSL